MTQDTKPDSKMEDEDTLYDYDMLDRSDTPTSTGTLPLRSKEQAGDEDAFGLRLHPLPSKDGVIVSVHPPIGRTRVPCDLVLIIDISGSMETPAPTPAMANGDQEIGSLTVLDLTKHAARAIIETMGDEDRLGVVTFTDEARVVLKLTQMTKANKARAWDQVKNIRSQGLTNLWHGILEGKKLLEGKQRRGAMPAMMLLTDGQPNQGCPPQGYVNRLRTYKLPAPIHCFGFGHGIGSALLQSIAEVASGNFAFISDASMLATVFIHAIANFQSTFAQGAQLNIRATGGLKLAQSLGEYIRPGEQSSKKPENDYQSSLTIPLNSIQFGQSRDILLHYGKGVSDNAKIKAEIKCHPLDRSSGTQSASCRVNDACGLSMEEIAFHRTRAAFCRFATSLAPIGKGGERERQPGSDKEKRKELEQLIAQTKQQNFDDKANNALLEDFTDQIKLAISNDYINSWGFHYLLSMYNAHFKQLCVSFKDPGQLQYSTHSPVFAAMRDQLSDLFDSLPPPKPTVTIRDRHGGTRTVSSNMRSYNMVDNPCFAADTPVRMANGSSVAISQLRAGSCSVWTPAGPRHVTGMLETRVTDQILCNVGNGKVGVTPWHPIMWAGQWTFPAHVAESVTFYSGAIYSVQLEADADPAAHAISVGGADSGVTAVTLGHGVVKTQDVRAHPFFADYNAVDAALRRLPTSDVTGNYISAGTFKGADGLVAGFVRPELQKAAENVPLQAGTQAVMCG